MTLCNLKDKVLIFDSSLSIVFSILSGILKIDFTFTFDFHFQKRTFFGYVFRSPFSDKDLTTVGSFSNVPYFLFFYVGLFFLEYLFWNLFTGGYPTDSFVNPLTVFLQVTICRQYFYVSLDFLLCQFVLVLLC